MRTAILAACILLLQALRAVAEEASLPDAAYRFDLKPSCEALNLPDGLLRFGKPCSFTRQESDGSTTRVVVFCDKLVEHLATLQMPVVTLTFEVPERPDMPKPVKSEQIMLATVHGRKMSDLGRGMYLICKEDPQGKLQRMLGIWNFGYSQGCRGARL